MAPSPSMIAWSKNDAGCCCQTSRRLSLRAFIRVSTSWALSAAEEIASRRRSGNTLRTENIQVGFVVTQPFQVIDGLAADQEVIGQIEDVVGFKRGDMPFEEVAVVVDGLGQTQSLDQQQKGSQACTAQSLGLVGEVIVDVLLFEQGPTLLVPLFFAQPVLDTALALTQALLYTVLHLKYLHARGKDDHRYTSISLEMPRYFKSFAFFSFRARGQMFA